MVDVADYKGIRCGNCGTIGKFTTGQLKKSKDCLKRPKTCKQCSAVTTTAEVPISMVPPTAPPLTPQVPAVPLSSDSIN